MEQTFWRERWDAGQIGFHQGQINPMLERFWPGLGLEGGRVLVPLCGKSLDLTWLALRGHEVIGVEFVQSASEAYFAERGTLPERDNVAGFDLFRGDGVTLVVADFFGVHPGVTGVIDAVYDRAAWVAIAPHERPRYAQQIRTLLRPGGAILLINFEHDLGSGPPFSIAEEEIRACWSGFTFERAFERDILDEEPRFRERGATTFREQVWIGTRE